MVGNVNRKKQYVKIKVLRQMKVSVLAKKVCCLQILMLYSEILWKLQSYRPGISTKAEQRRLKTMQEISMSTAA